MKDPRVPASDVNGMVIHGPDCEAVERALTRGHALLPTPLQDHLATCVACRSEQRALLRLPTRTGGRGVSPQEASLFVRGVMAQVRREVPPGVRRRRYERRRWVLQAAALITLALLTGIWTGSGGSLVWVGEHVDVSAGSGTPPAAVNLDVPVSAFHASAPKIRLDEWRTTLDDSSLTLSRGQGWLRAVSRRADGPEVLSF